MNSLIKAMLILVNVVSNMKYINFLLCLSITYSLSLSLCLSYFTNIPFSHHLVIPVGAAAYDDDFEDLLTLEYIEETAEIIADPKTIPTSVSPRAKKPLLTS